MEGEGEGEGETSRVTLDLNPIPRTSLFFLLTTLCTIPTICAPRLTGLKVSDKQHLFV